MSSNSRHGLVFDDFSVANVVAAPEYYNHRAAFPYIRGASHVIQIYPLPREVFSDGCAGACAPVRFTFLKPEWCIQHALHDVVQCFHAVHYNSTSVLRYSSAATRNTQELASDLGRTSSLWLLDHLHVCVAKNIESMSG